MTICKVEGCPQRSVVKGMCRMHYDRERLGWVRRVSRYKPDATCAVEGCTRRPYAKHKCHMHRRQELSPPKGNLINQGKICSKEGCTKPAVSRLMCKTHYVEQRRKENRALDRQMFDSGVN